MSAPASVEALKYEILVQGIGVRSCIEKCIFIRSHQLNIGENGEVTKSDQHSFTLAAHKAQELVLDKISSGKYRGNKSTQQLLQEAEKKADKTALTPIQIPKNLVDRIQALYEKSIDGDTPQGQVPLLKREIAQIFQQIWNS